MKPKFPFYSHQEQKKIPISPSIREQFGDYPTVNTLFYDEQGNLSKETVPVIYLTNDVDQSTHIVITTGKKNGLITLS